MNPRFVRVLHRARDAVAAREFYTAVLGDPELEIVPLPESVAARGVPSGVPSHWLGAIGVDDVDRALAALVARGGTPRGPVHNDARGAFAIVAGPGGALVALASPPKGSPRPAIAWAHLDAHDAAAAFEHYAAVFGWRTTEAIDVGPLRAVQFAWEPGGPDVGSYADLARRPDVHPQWLLQFPVASIDAAVETVRREGGVVLNDVVVGGARVAVCDDPQGGGFALRGRSDNATGP